MRRTLSLLMVLLLLTACSAGPSMYLEDCGESYFDGACENYSGPQSCTLTLGENACINLHCTVERKGGSVDIEVRGSGERYAYDGLHESMELVLQLTEPGEYTISVDADDFTGNFHFEWETVGAAP